MDGTDEEHDPDLDGGDRAKRLRERGAALLASVTLHAQRLTELAEQSGLLCDPPEHLGSTVYETVLLQLELATSVAERTQRVADRVLDTLQRKAGHDHAALIEAEQGQAAHHRFVVRNDASREGKIVARVDERASRWARVEMTDTELKVGEETSIYVVFTTSALEPNKPYVGELTVCLEQSQLLARRFELWVRSRSEDR